MCEKKTVTGQPLYAKQTIVHTYSDPRLVFTQPTVKASTFLRILRFSFDLRFSVPDSHFTDHQGRQRA